MSTSIIPLIKKHIQRIPQNKRIVIFVLLILIANQIGGNIAKLFISLSIKVTPQYIFKDIWNDALPLFKKFGIYFFSIIPGLNLIITLIGLACFRRIAEQFIPGYWIKYKKRGSSTTSAILWYYKQKLYINLGFLFLVGAFYIFCNIIYQYIGINSLLLFALWIILLYPVYYFTQATTALLATLPLKNHERNKSLSFLYCKKGIKALYIFYCVRLGLELFLVFLLPVILSKLQILEFLIPWLAIAGLAVPFTFLRSLSYEIKLKIFQGDEKIDSLLN